MFQPRVKMGMRKVALNKALLSGNACELLQDGRQVGVAEFQLKLYSLYCTKIDLLLANNISR